MGCAASGCSTWCCWTGSNARLRYKLRKRFGSVKLKIESARYTEDNIICPKTYVPCTDADLLKRAMHAATHHPVSDSNVNTATGTVMFHPYKTSRRFCDMKADLKKHFK